jgi:hypothetical protein
MNIRRSCISPALWAEQIVCANIWRVHLQRNIPTIFEGLYIVSEHAYSYQVHVVSLLSSRVRMRGCRMTLQYCAHTAPEVPDEAECTSVIETQ